MEDKNARYGRGVALEQQHSSTQSVSRKRLDPALKSWLDNVIIPALVRDYLTEIEKQNRLATRGGSEVLSEQDG